MVRLLRAERELLGEEEVEFQSHNGAIAARRLTREYLQRKRFNPTMVRLLLPTPLVRKFNMFQFQSHNGAIAAKGTGRWEWWEVSFNPTMVRLLLSEGAFTS